MCIPSSIIKKANKLIKLVEAKEITPRKTIKHNHKVITVNPWYRLLNKGKGWELMTHAKYNKEIDRC